MVLNVPPSPRVTRVSPTSLRVETPLREVVPQAKPRLTEIRVYFGLGFEETNVRAIERLSFSKGRLRLEELDALKCMRQNVPFQNFKRYLMASL